MNNVSNFTYNFKNARILIIGDIMLDNFVYGAVDRVSPEGPIPVLSAQNEKKMLGGAGNVLANAASLGAKCDIISVVGEDNAGEQVTDLLRQSGGNSNFLITDNTRPTILKTRYIAQNQQLLRVDHERAVAISAQVESHILENAKIALKNKHVLILSDYGKGVLTDNLTQALIKLANDVGVVVIVDPKGKNFLKYTGADIITPNKKELSEGAGNAQVLTDAQIEAAAMDVIDRCGIKSVVATRSEDGISVVNKERSVHISTDVREVYDVSGAGDTVVATVAVVLGAGGTLERATELANIAGGVVVGKIGTAVIAEQELHDAVNAKNISSFIAPIVSWESAAQQIKEWQSQGLQVGMTGGCFDIIHYGHVHYFAQARARCDKLVVALNTDASVQILKGPTRPVNDQEARATVIAALGSCDMVVFFGAAKKEDDNTPYEILSILRPDTFFKGGDYTVDQLPEAKAVLAYGGKIDIMPLYDGYSTTSIIEKASS